MLTACKGATSFEDIRTVENVLYPTYRETCFAMGFLQDDREFVEAIKINYYFLLLYYPYFKNIKRNILIFFKNKINKRKHLTQ